MHARREEYHKLLSLFDTETINNPQIKDDIIEALGEIRDPDILDEIISDVLWNKIREQDVWHQMKVLSLNKHATTKLWNYITFRNGNGEYENWNRILKKFIPGSSGLTYIVKVIAGGFTTNIELDKYIAFFTERPVGTDMSIRQTIESTKSKITSIDRIVADSEFKSLLSK